MTNIEIDKVLEFSYKYIVESQYLQAKSEKSHKQLDIDKANSFSA